MSELVAVEHYKAVREELMERIRQREKYIFYFLTGSGGAFAVFASNQSFAWIFLAIPCLAFFVGIMYAQADKTVGSLSLWLRTEYSDMLRKLRLTGHDEVELVHWDGSGDLKGYYNSRAFSQRYVAVAALLSVSVWGATFLAIYYSKELPWNDLGFYALFCVVLAIISSTGAIQPYFALHYRRKQVSKL